MASHVIMKKSLAKALMDSGMQHFDVGGPVGSGSTTAGGVGGILSNLWGTQNKYQATAPTITTQDTLLSNISEQEGINQGVYGQQQSLAQALLARSQGQGPNPAQAALNQNTGNNIASQAALMASARGGNSNPGLIAEEAARQGAATEQQAVGQGATLQAQQELEAQKELQNLYSTEGSNALTAQGILQGAQAAQNSAETTGQLGAEEANAQVAAANATNAANASGGFMGAVGGALSLYKGGRVPKFYDGGIQTYSAPIDPRVIVNVPAPTSDKPGLIGSIFKGIGAKQKAPTLSSSHTPSNTPDFTLDGTGGTEGEAGGLAGDAADVGATDAAGAAAADATGEAAGGGGLAILAANGGKVPAAYGTGSGFGGARPIDFRTGGPVPGRAKVRGNSPKNDTVPALVSPGEEILPRSVTMAPDAPERAKRFVEALRDQKGEGSKGFGKVLKAKATLKERVARLEKLCAGGVA